MRRRAFISRQKLGKAVNWFRLSGSNMLVEVAKPVTLVFCILSLYAVFSSAFLDLSIDLHQRLCESLLRLALSGRDLDDERIDFRDATLRAMRAHDKNHSDAACAIILLGFECHARYVRTFLAISKRTVSFTGMFVSDVGPRLDYRLRSRRLFGAFSSQSYPDAEYA